jgi:hypothetical protein
LYIDGGLVNYKPFSSSSDNLTSKHYPWLMPSKATSRDRG